METKKQLRKEIEYISELRDVWKKGYEDKVAREYEGRVARFASSPAMNENCLCAKLVEQTRIAEREKARVSSLEDFIISIIKEYPDVVAKRAAKVEEELEKRVSRAELLKAFCGEVLDPFLVMERLGE